MSEEERQFIEAQKKARKVMDDLLSPIEGFLTGLGDVPSESHAYLKPSDEPKHWELKHRVIRLDKVVMAMHLISARVAMRAFPTIYQQTINKAVALAKKFGAWSVLQLVAKSFIKAATVVGFALQAKDQISAEQSAQEVERTIRLICVTVMRDLKGQPLAQKRSSRKVRDVHTRHKTRKKRRQHPYKFQ